MTANWPPVSSPLARNVMRDGPNQIVSSRLFLREKGVVSVVTIGNSFEVTRRENPEKLSAGPRGAKSDNLIRDKEVRDMKLQSRLRRSLGMVCAWLVIAAAGLWIMHAQQRQ